MFWSFWPIGQIPLGARLAFCRAGQPVFFPWGGASSRASLASICNTSVHVLKLCPIQLFMFSAAGFSQFLTNKGRRVWCSREEAGFSFYFVSGPRAAFPKVIIRWSRCLGIYSNAFLIRMIHTRMERNFESFTFSAHALLQQVRRDCVCSAEFFKNYQLKQLSTTKLSAKNIKIIS